MNHTYTTKGLTPSRNRKYITVILSLMTFMDQQVRNLQWFQLLEKKKEKNEHSLRPVWLGICNVSNLEKKKKRFMTSIWLLCQEFDVVTTQKSNVSKSEKKEKNIHGFHMVNMLGICSGYNSEKNKHSVALMKREAKGTSVQLVCTSVCF